MCESVQYSHPHWIWRTLWRPSRFNVNFAWFVIFLAMVIFLSKNNTEDLGQKCRSNYFAAATGNRLLLWSLIPCTSWRAPAKNNIVYPSSWCSTFGNDDGRETIKLDFTHILLSGPNIPEMHLKVWAASDLWNPIQFICRWKKRIW